MEHLISTSMSSIVVCTTCWTYDWSRVWAFCNKRCGVECRVGCCKHVGCRRHASQKISALGSQASISEESVSSMSLLCPRLIRFGLAMQALRRDLHALENDARAFAAELEEAQEWVSGQPSLQQLEGRFRCLAGMYKAHSQVLSSSNRDFLESMYLSN